MSKIEGLIFSGPVTLTTDFGEEKVSAKGTPFRAALARDGRGTTYRLFAFDEVLKRALMFRKGGTADVLGEVLSVREGIIGLALKDISDHEAEESEEDDIPF